MRKRFWAAFASALVVMAAPAAAQTAAPLRAWNTHPDGYPVTEAMKSFIAEVESGTQGRYTIKLFSDAVLGDQSKAVQMLKAGEIDVAEFNLGPLAEAVHALQAFNLPFLFSDASHMFRYLDGAMGDRLAEKLKASGYVVLGWYNGGARSFYCANKPIARREDLAGQRIRVQQVDTHIEMVKLLGATPVVVPYREVLDGFRNGTIDCAEGNLVSYESTGHYKVAKYMLLDQHMISPEALVVSTKLWDRLKPEDRQVFIKAGKNSAVLMRGLWEKRVLAARSALGKEGVQFAPVSDFSPYVRRMAPLYKKYTDNPEVRGDLLTIISNQ
ncbi:TRAP transporter substrate-binding protein [Acidovorax sp. GBBC 3334]|uniref:TRAP transporter substrate-binding protein n=1 Tax=Acidovorax sp. GBBC 3334 TaxID=2940496 RepID=UPI003FA48986